MTDIERDNSIDKATLHIKNLDHISVLDLWGQSEECYLCSPWKYLSLKPASDAVLKVNSTYRTNLFIASPHEFGYLHNYSFHFVQRGIYSLDFNSTNFPPITTEHQGNNEYIAILAAFLCFLFLYLFWVGVKCLHKRMQEENRSYPVIIGNANSSSTTAILHEEEPSANENEESTETIVTEPVSASSRLRSLDTFRGITIVIMIFVNYGGGKYYFFKHSPWNGLTVADLAFPWFLWIMGMSLTFSVKSLLRRETPYYIIIWKIIKRSLILFAIGIILNSLHSNSLPNLRIPGVLQRFAICYPINALLEVFRMKSQAPDENFRFWVLRDLIWSWVQWLTILIFIVLHTVIIFALEVPGCPKGYLGPGGVHMQGQYPNCTGGAAGYLDRILLGPNHIYGHPTSKIIYNSNVPFDPEGTLGILTSLLTVQLGVAAGRIILYFPNHSRRLKEWISFGIITGILGGFLCGWSKEGGLLPVNKNLWSLSYVFVTSSFAFILFSLLYYWIDYAKRWNGTIFRVAGMNSILLYIGHELTKRLFPWSWTPVPPYHANHLAMNLWGTSLWLITAYVCHKKKIYLSV